MTSDLPEEEEPDPAMTSHLPEEEEEQPDPAVTFGPRVGPGDQQGVPTQTPNRNQTSDPEPGNITTPTTKDPAHVTAPPTSTFRSKATPPDPSYHDNQREPTSPSLVRTTAQTAGPSDPPVEPDPRDPELVEPRYTDPVQPHPAQVVVVDEDLDEDGRWAEGGC